VTLINTDGLAFIGPGSEWFWTMLQFIALATTFSPSIANFGRNTPRANTSR
jgi:hypothetical protein